MQRLKSKIIRKILGILVIVGCSGIFFNGYVGIGEPVHAQQQGIGNWSTGSGSAIDSMSLWTILNMVLKIIYLLLWPLLVVAGLALDNTLVYASIFHLDAPLWKFWNMIKNFANFALWFMVLFAIIKSLFSVKEDKWPIEIIKKTLIAGILIQASWFLMAALVDVSTIATYAVGGLPLSVLKNTDIGNQKILTTNSSLDLNKFSVISAWGEDFQVWNSTTYSGKLFKISPCRIEKSYVIWRENADPDFINSDKFVGTNFEWYEVCTLFGNQLVMWKEGALLSEISAVTNSTYNTGSNLWYKTIMSALLNRTWWDSSSSTFIPFMVNVKSWSALASVDWFAKGKDFFNWSSAITISELINKSKWFVWPLVTMYSSLLNFAQLTDTNVTTISETSGIFLIKAGVAIALFFPLLALAVVLIMRIGMLWLYIAASPFLVITKVFDKLLPKDLLWGNLDITNVFKLIFAPVVTVAALSISLIFMTALVNGFKSGDTQHISSAVSENLQIQSITPTTGGNQAFQISPSTSLEFKNFDRGWSLDWFSRLVVNFFAIWLLRTIVFAAIKSNKIGEKIGGGIQKFGANVFSTLPVLPMGAGGAWVWIGSAYNVLSKVPERKVEDRQYNDQEKVRELLEPSDKGSNTTLTSESTNKIVNSLWGLTNPTNKTETEKVFSANNIATTSIANNNDTFFRSIEAISNPQEKNKAIQGIETIAWAWRYDRMVKEETKKNFSSKIADKIIKNTDVNKLLSNNKDIADAYFKSNNNLPFEKTLDGGKNKITITPQIDPKDTLKITGYTVTEIK